MFDLQRSLAVSTSTGWVMVCIRLFMGPVRLGMPAESALEFMGAYLSFFISLVVGYYLTIKTIEFLAFYFAHADHRCDRNQ